MDQVDQEGLELQYPPLGLADLRDLECLEYLECLANLQDLEARPFLLDLQVQLDPLGLERQLNLLHRLHQ